MSGGEVADWIIARAQARGITISRRQLVKWHQAKLIPRPERQFRGRPKAGSVSVYPAGTLEQAVACERWLRRDRNIARVGWRLWTEGFDVGNDLWERPFVEAQEMFQIVADAMEAEDIASSDLLQSIREALQSHNVVMQMIR